MLNFSCPVCASRARVLDHKRIGDRVIIKFNCRECCESGVDDLPVEAESTPKQNQTPWRYPKTERKPEKPPREKRDKPKQKPKPTRKATLEAQVKRAWDDYMLARMAFRAGAVSRAKSDIARDVWVELSKKLRRYEPQEVKEIA